MNREKAVEIKKELDQAIASVLARHGLEFAYPSICDVSPTNGFQFAFETTSNTIRLRRLNHWKSVLGDEFNTVDIKQAFRLDSVHGQVFTLIDIDPRKNSAPWVAENEEGKRCLLSTKVVREALMDAHERRYNLVGRAPRGKLKRASPREFATWG